MGSEHSKNIQRITAGQLQNALENQRKLYEKQTMALLAAQREVLTKSAEKQSNSQHATSSTHNVTAASNNVLYPNLPTVPTTNAHEALLYMNGRMHPPQPSIPSAPPIPNHLSFETQTSAYIPTSLPSVIHHKPTNLFTRNDMRTKQKCPNSLDGCTLRFNTNELDEHLLECPFKELTCPVNVISRCAWKGKIPSAPPIPNHLSFETQTSAYIPTSLPSVIHHKPTNLFTRNDMRTKQKCPNSLDGCTLRFNTNELDEHLLECPFKELTCPVNVISRCAWKGKITQLVSHFDENHPECREAKVNKEDTVHIGQNYQFLSLIDMGPFNFLLHVIIKPHTKEIIFGVQLLGTKISASKWTYELRIYNKNDPRRLFEYIDSCQSNSIPLHKLLAEDKVAKICFDYAKTFSQQEVITYKIFLKKMDSRNNNRNPKQQSSRTTST